MRRRWLRSVLWIAALGLFVWGGSARVQTRAGTRSVLERVLGPVASLAASVQLLRAELAFQHHRPGEGYALAESALALDPGATDAWTWLAYHMIVQRAARDAEADPARRALWIREGLAVLARGEEHARAPEVLAFEQGLFLLQVVAKEAEAGDLPWPGGAEAARSAALEALERAARGGHTFSAGLLEKLRERGSDE